MDFKYNGKLYKLNPGFDRKELEELITEPYDKFENEFETDVTGNHDPNLEIEEG